LDENDWRNEGYVVSTVTLKDTGLFKVSVLGSDWQEVGPYSVELLIDPYVDVALGATPLGNIAKPTKRIGTGSMRQPGIRFTFGSIETHPVTFSPPSNCTTHSVRKLVTADDWRNNGYIEASFEIKSIGRYTLIVRGRDRAQLGAYSLQVLPD